MLNVEPKRKYNGLEQCRAVLAVWSERQSATELCRRLQISSGLLSLWQERAMEGLLAALEPREGRENGEKRPSLSTSLKRLLEKKAVERESLGRLHSRLARANPRPSPVAELAPTGTKEG
jgi:hypothetical protein